MIVFQYFSNLSRTRLAQFTFIQFDEDRLADAFRQEFGDADRGPPAGKMGVGGITLAGLGRVCAKAMASPSALNCGYIVTLAPTTVCRKMAGSIRRSSSHSRI